MSICIDRSPLNHQNRLKIVYKTRISSRTIFFMCRYLPSRLITTCAYVSVHIKFNIMRASKYYISFNIYFIISIQRLRYTRLSCLVDQTSRYRGEGGRGGWHVRVHSNNSTYILYYIRPIPNMVMIWSVIIISHEVRPFV